MITINRISSHAGAQSISGSLVMNRTMAYICTPHVPKFPGAGAGKISILGLNDVSGELC
jgi:hypothetical protein